MWLERQRRAVVRDAGSRVGLFGFKTHPALGLDIPGLQNEEVVSPTQRTGRHRQQVISGHQISMWKGLRKSQLHGFRNLTNGG